MVGNIRFDGTQQRYTQHRGLFDKSNDAGGNIPWVCKVSARGQSRNEVSF